MRLDHLVISAATLDEGCDWVAAHLGIRPAGGGRHVHMGTHNRLLGLGDLYLEVIAIDPAGETPAQPRWFALDEFSGPPRLTNWVVAVENLRAELAQAPAGAGEPWALSRGDLRWHVGVPPDGRLPFDGGFPLLIHWDTALHPTAQLPDSLIRLTRLEIEHPRAGALRPALAGLHDPRVAVIEGAAPRLRAEFATPGGTVWL